MLAGTNSAATGDKPCLEETAARLPEFKLGGDLPVNLGVKMGARADSLLFTAVDCHVITTGSPPPLVSF